MDAITTHNLVFALYEREEEAEANRLFLLGCKEILTRCRSIS